MRILLIFAVLITIWACSSQPVPQWQETSSRQLENYKVYFLTDKEDATEPHFVQARKAISGNNNLHLLATAYLTKYALYAATLEDFDDTEFLRIDKLQPDAAYRAYYNFLKGDFGKIEADMLPPAYRKIISLMLDKNITAANKQIANITDPLSRLIACGIRVKYLPYDENSLQLAIDTAADQGWSRPLWAYLTRLEKYYLKHNETIKAQKIKDRLELLKQWP
ncbi:MAG: hypothetical protein ABFD50_07525 [Smithella sp.]